VQSHLQHYSEPSTSSDAALPGTSSLSGTLLPLGPGCLTHNAAGVPIVVVCTKADLIDEENDIIGAAGGMGGMVKGKGGEWEERTDGVMQVLRTICLKCTYQHVRIVPHSYFVQMALVCSTRHSNLKRCLFYDNTYYIYYSHPPLLQ